MNMPPIVSPQEWEAARQELLVEEKELTAPYQWWKLHDEYGEAA